ncbi:MAG TPA: serine kinase [Candidatus Binatia bacterium]|nr:serine kinase [Candidatus Binatia bacterium]
MFSYTAYGLGIHSFLPLPELVSQEKKADILIRRGKVNGSDLEIIDSGRSFRASSEEARYCFAGIGRFLARGGQEVTVDALPGTDERALRLCLLGPVLALILHQRRQLILHASAVSVGGKAVVFLGGQGWGKSTIAAALHLRGHEMLADDVTTIHMDSACPMVLPAFPQFKLWPDSVRALGKMPDCLPLLHSAINKRAYRIRWGFAQNSLPLKYIYVLAEGRKAVIERLDSRESFVELMRHSYVVRFGRKLLQGQEIATHFNQCARLVRHTCLYRFRRPAALSLLHEHANMLIKELSRES